MSLEDVSEAVGCVAQMQDEPSSIDGEYAVCIARRRAETKLIA